MSLARLIAVFEKANIPVSPRELADAVWLATQLTGEGVRPSAPGSEPEMPGMADRAPPTFARSSAEESKGLPDLQTSDPTAGLPSSPALHATTGQGAGVSRHDAVSARIPAATPLPGGLGLLRALRPLKRAVPSGHLRIFDEEATANRIAADRLAIPVLRPGSERWLTLTLVVDSSRSMVIWDPLVDGLRTLLERFGGFRDVRLHYLNTDSPGKVFVHARHNGKTLEHSPAEVIDPTGRQVILLVSDCVGDAWQFGAVGPVLDMWGRKGPLAILQPLPQQLWARTAIIPVPARLHAPSPGLSNHRLGVECASDPVGIPVPLLEIESEWLASWARIVSGAGDGSTPVIAAFTGMPTRPEREPVLDEDGAIDRIIRFRSSATQQAFKLAGYLALTPLALPVMRLVQQAMLPGSRPTHLAEVFLSGLLRRVDSESAYHDLISYDFVGDDVREALIGTVRRSEAIRVLERVSQYLDARVGGDTDFATLIPVRPGSGDRDLADSLGKFGWLPDRVLQRLGGRYAKLVHVTASLKSPPVPSRDSRKPRDISSPHVVVVYSPEDEQWALRLLSARLRLDGFPVISFPLGALPNEMSLRKLEEHLHHLDRCILVYSRAVANSDSAAEQFSSVISMARRTDNVVIPALIQDVEPDSKVASLVWVDFRDQDWEQAYLMLAAGLGGLRTAPARKEVEDSTAPTLLVPNESTVDEFDRRPPQTNYWKGISAEAGSPAPDTWVAAIHSSEHDFEPIGAAVVIDAHRILTCAHVVISSDGMTREPLWVAFPKADEDRRRRVAAVTVAYSPPVRDLAVLVLEEPVPAHVEPAPLRLPKASDLVGLRWWAFGFPNHDPVGNSVSGSVGASLSYGWIRLDAESRYLLEPGFSGGGLWSPEYGAVVGLVGHASEQGDGRAIMLNQANLYFPEHKLAMLANWSAVSSSELALAEWGWTLARDPEGVRHWRPRARGVSIDSERGYRFRGRAAALTQIVAWLDRPEPDRRVLMVTGSPGVGKSAVLGRVVITADAAIRALLPSGDDAVRASVGSVSCAVHAKAKTALEVAEEIARAASARLPENADDLAPTVREALDGRGGRFNVIIDALDEAASPGQARAIIDRVVLPLVETCSDAGAQVVVGSRRRDDGGDLLGRLGGALAVIDLDAPEFFAEEDLATYALACLQLEGDERPGNPYRDYALAAPLAQRIAAMAGRNFLVAGLIARSHGLHDEEAAGPDQLGFSATVDSALASYLQHLSPVAGLSASSALTALAFAEAPGMPIGLWRLAIEAIDGTRLSADDLTRFARSSAANFLVETGSNAAEGGYSTPGGAVYRLFHQALNDALLRARSDVTPRAADERALTLAFTKQGRLSRWEDAAGYLLRSLPNHADAAGLIDDLLADNNYLLHADLRRLIPLADRSASPASRPRVRLLQLTPQAIPADPQNRAAMFSVTEALENLGESFASSPRAAPYRALWTSVPPRRERAILQGHEDWVSTVRTFKFNDQVVLASASNDGTVRIWDPATGEQQAILTGHIDAVTALCPFFLHDRVLLASSGMDRKLRIWDPATGEQQAILTGHTGAVREICAFALNDRDLLASAGDDGTVRIWDPATRQLRAVLTGHTGAVRGVCAFALNGRELLASAGIDLTVRIWDPATSDNQAPPEGRNSDINGLCAVSVHDRILLASAGDDGTVRIWDPVAGEQQAALTGHVGAVRGVCAVPAVDQSALASAGDDRTVRIWDPVAGEQRAALAGHAGAVQAVCAFTLNGQVLLASAGDDRTVRTWDPVVGMQHALQGHHGEIHGLCTLTLGGRVALASAGIDRTVRIWDPAAGMCMLALPTHHPALGVDQVGDSLVVGLTGGILAVELDRASIWA
jgi:WD40 repeat protein